MTDVAPKQTSCYCCRIACEDAVSICGYGSNCVNLCVECNKKIWAEVFNGSDAQLNTKDSKAWDKSWTQLKTLKEQIEQSKHNNQALCYCCDTTTNRHSSDPAYVNLCNDCDEKLVTIHNQPGQYMQHKEGGDAWILSKWKNELDRFKTKSKASKEMTTPEATETTKTKEDGAEYTACYCCGEECIKRGGAGHITSVCRDCAVKVWLSETSLNATKANIEATSKKTDKKDGEGFGDLRPALTAAIEKVKAEYHDITSPKIPCFICGKETKNWNVKYPKDHYLNVCAKCGNSSEPGTGFKLFGYPFIEKRFAIEEERNSKVMTAIDKSTLKVGDKITVAIKGQDGQVSNREAIVLEEANGLQRVLLNEPWNDSIYSSYSFAESDNYCKLAQKYGYVAGKLIWHLSYNFNTVTSVNGHVEPTKIIDASKLQIGDKVELEINLKSWSLDSNDTHTRNAWVVGFSGGSPYFALEGKKLEAKNGSTPCYYRSDFANCESNANRLGVQSDSDRHIWLFDKTNTTIKTVLQDAPPLVDLKTVKVGDRIEVEWKPGYCGAAIVLEKPSDNQIVYAYEESPRGKTLNYPNTQQISLYSKYGLELNYSCRSSDSSTKIYTNYGQAPTFIEHKDLAMGDMIDFNIRYDGKDYSSKGLIVYEDAPNDSYQVLCQAAIKDITNDVTGVAKAAAQEMGWDVKTAGAWSLTSSDRVFSKQKEQTIETVPFESCEVGDVLDLEYMDTYLSFRAEALVVHSAGNTVHVVLKDKRDSAQDCSNTYKPIAEKYGFGTTSTAYNYLNYTNAVVHKKLGKAPIQQVNPFSSQLQVGTSVSVCVGKNNPVKAVVIQTTGESPYGEPIVAFESPNASGWNLDEVQGIIASRYGINKTNQVGLRIDGCNAFITKVHNQKGLSISNCQNGDRIKIRISEAYKDNATPICQEATVIANNGTSLTIILDEIYRDTHGNLNNSTYISPAQKEQAKLVGLDLADNDPRVYMVANNAAIIVEENLSRDLDALPETSNQPNIQALLAGDRILLEITDSSISNGESVNVYATVLGTQHDNTGLPFVYLGEELEGALILDSEKNLTACETLGLKSGGKTGWLLNPANTKVVGFKDKNSIEPATLNIGDRVQVDIESWDDNDELVVSSQEAIYLGAEDRIDNVFYLPNLKDSEDPWAPEKNSLPQVAMDHLGLWIETKNATKNAKCLYDLEGISVRKILSRSSLVVDKEALAEEVAELQADDEDDLGDCQCSECVPEVYGTCYKCADEVCINQTEQGEFDPDQDIALCGLCLGKHRKALEKASVEFCYDSASSIHDECWPIYSKSAKTVVKVMDAIDNGAEGELEDIIGSCYNCDAEMSIPAQGEDGEYDDFDPLNHLALCKDCITKHYHQLIQHGFNLPNKDKVVDEYYLDEGDQELVHAALTDSSRHLAHYQLQEASVKIKQATNDDKKLKPGDRIRVSIHSTEDEDVYITSTAVVMGDLYDAGEVWIALECNVQENWEDLPFDLDMSTVKDYDKDSVARETADYLKLDHNYSVWSIDAKTDITAVLSGKYATNKGEKAMPYDNDGNEMSFGELIKSDAVNAGYRVAATQMTKGVKAAVLLAMKDKGMEGGKVQAIAEMLDTELGSAFVAAFLGYSLAYVPGIGEDPRVQKLSTEFRINGLSSAGNVLADQITSYIMPAITGAMNNLPALPESTPVVKKPAKKRSKKDDGGKGITVDHSSHN